MNTYYKTAEEYRQRMIEAFHNADCDHLIALVRLPNEKEFTHLECLLKHELPNISDTNSVSDNQYAIGHQNGYRDGLCDAIKAIKNIAESEEV